MTRIRPTWPSGLGPIAHEVSSLPICSHGLTNSPQSIVRLTGTASSRLPMSRTASTSPCRAAGQRPSACRAACASRNARDKGHATTPRARASASRTAGARTAPTTTDTCRPCRTSPSRWRWMTRSNTTPIWPRRLRQPRPERAQRVCGWTPSLLVGERGYVHTVVTDR